MLGKPQRQLAGRGRLARSLQPDHQIHRRRNGRPANLLLARPEDRDEFVLDNLEHLLRRRKRGLHVLAKGLLTDVLDELLTTWKLTSASSNAERISRKPSWMCSSDSLPCPRKFLKARCSSLKGCRTRTRMKEPRAEYRETRAAPPRCSGSRGTLQGVREYPPMRTLALLYAPAERRSIASRAPGARQFCETYATARSSQ